MTSQKLIEEFLKKDKSDYYSILSVSRNASDEEIKKAYRKLSLQFHPDKNKETKAVDCFVIVGKAFEILSDRRKRKEYDLKRSTQRHFSQSFSSEELNVSPEEIFAELFRTFQRRERSRFEVNTNPFHQYEFGFSRTQNFTTELVYIFVSFLLSLFKEIFIRVLRFFVNI